MFVTLSSTSLDYTPTVRMVKCIWQVSAMAVSAHRGCGDLGQKSTQSLGRVTAAVPTGSLQ